MMKNNFENYTEEFLETSNQLMSKIPKEKVVEIMEVIEEVRQKGGTVYTIGNGGSASTAEHLAADLDKTANKGQEKLFRSITLVNNDPLTSAWTNDEGWESVYKGQLEDRITEDDALIAFSVHGGSGPWSGNLVKALNFANDKNAFTIGIAGFDGGAFTDVCDISLVVPSESTPQVESFHVLIHHMIVFGLKESIEE